MLSKNLWFASSCIHVAMPVAIDKVYSASTHKEELYSCENSLQQSCLLFLFTNICLWLSFHK